MMKREVLEHIVLHFGALDPPILAGAPKALVRGFKHPMTARLLLPVQSLDEFDADEEA